VTRSWGALCEYGSEHSSPHGHPYIKCPTPDLCAIASPPGRAQARLLPPWLVYGCTASLAGWAVLAVLVLAVIVVVGRW
jgi:hypothetical protein